MILLVVFPARTHGVLKQKVDCQREEEACTLFDEAANKRWAEYKYDRLPHAVLLNGRGYSLRLQVPSDESREVQMSKGTTTPRFGPEPRAG